MWGGTVSTPELDRVRGSRSLTALRRSLSAPKMSRCGHSEFAADPAELIDWPGPPHLWVRRVSRSPASKGHAMARPTERPACSALARQRKSEDPSQLAGTAKVAAAAAVEAVGSCATTCKSCEGCGGGGGFPSSETGADTELSDCQVTFSDAKACSTIGAHCEYLRHPSIRSALMAAAALPRDGSLAAKLSHLCTSPQRSSLFGASIRVASIYMTPDSALARHIAASAAATDGMRHRRTFSLAWIILSVSALSPSQSPWYLKARGIPESVSQSCQNEKKHDARRSSAVARVKKVSPEN